MSTILDVVPAIAARARALGITLKSSSLRDAISYALLDRPYNIAAFSARQGRADPIVLPPPHLIAAAERFRIDAGLLGRAVDLGMGDAHDEPAYEVRWINAIGRAEIVAFLGENFAAAVASGEGAAYFTDSMLDAWLADAEFQLSEGNNAAIEISAADSASGHTCRYSVSASGVSSAVAKTDSDAVTCELDLDAVRETPAPLY